jgi:hypothetical protein
MHLRDLQKMMTNQKTTGNGREIGREMTTSPTKTGKGIGREIGREMTRIGRESLTTDSRYLPLAPISRRDQRDRRNPINLVNQESLGIRKRISKRMTMMIYHTA